MPIAPPNRHQVDNNTCGSCAKKWRECKCNADSRTDSVASLFLNEDIFADKEHRHTCVFLYHPYQRWSIRDGQGLKEFSLALLPLWEGWYAAWLKPELDFPIEVSWSEKPVLQVSLRYVNGSFLDGFIDTEGRLFLSVPGVRPPEGKDYDEDRGLIRVAVSVCQGLTMDEIRTSSRGIVYGGRSAPNSWRKVSHVLREQDGKCVVKLLAEKEDEPGAEAVIETERVQQYVPQFLEEVKWRGRRRFRRALAKSVQQYLHALFERARLNDKAVRYALARGWMEGLTSPKSLIKDVVREVNALARGVEVEPGSEDSKGQSPQNGDGGEGKEGGNDEDRRMSG